MSDDKVFPRQMSKRCDVLIVDDDHLVVETVKEWVLESGRAAYSADSGIQALGILRSHPKIQVFLTDIRMPVMDGNELIRHAIKLRPDLKILVMTGNLDDVAIQDYFEIIEKPFNSERLAEVLTRACGDHGSPPSRPRE